MAFFEDKINRKAKGKTPASLEKSREIRQGFIKEYGYVPTSILRSRNKKASKQIVLTGRTYDQVSAKQKNKRGLTKTEKKIYRMGGMGVRNGALSSFPQDIGKLITKFYTRENETVYDPFIGHNSRMQLVFELNRNYIGIDISKIFMDFNRKIRKKLLKDNTIFKNNNKITLIEKSSASVPEIETGSADFTITSPPYWNIEDYGNEKEQLGKTKTYDSFLSSLFKHIEENYRILKKGSFCCWFVNDFTLNKIFYPYHADLIPLFIKTGFILHTINIIELCTHTVFVQDIIKQKKFRKVHEYCLIFKK